MAKKKRPPQENWEDVFPGLAGLIHAYTDLTLRELIIVAAGIVDTALVALLQRRVLNYSKECNEFLGITGYGQAPAASLSARTRLALLLGILRPTDASVIDALRDLRNLYAHRVRVPIESEEVLSMFWQLHRSYEHRKYDLRVVPDESGIVPSDDFKRRVQADARYLPSMIQHILRMLQADFHRFCLEESRIEAPKYHAMPEPEPVRRAKTAIRQRRVEEGL